MNRPRLLDLFCCAGGAAMGYYRGTQRGTKAASLGDGRSAMGIDWMTWPELAEAIPPAYTEHLGSQLLAGIVTAHEERREQ